MASVGLSSRAIQGEFFQTLEGAFNKSWVSSVAMMTGSNQQYEEYRFLGMAPPLRKWTGQRAPVRFTSKGLKIANEVWDASVNVSVDDLRRDKTGQISLRIQELADRVVEHYDKQLTNFIINGDADVAGYGLAYDDQFFFDTDHSEGSSGTLQNNIDSSDVGQLNVATATAPTQAEMVDAILGVIAYALAYKDDQGEFLNGNARSFIAMLPTNLYGAAIGATRNAMVAGASGAAFNNNLAASEFNVTAVCNPRLDADSTSIFYLFRTDGRTKPFIVQEEEAVTFDTSLAEGSEYASENREHQYTAEWIGGFGYGQWQHAVRATLS